MDGGDHTTTESEEMYLITVARAMEDGEGPLVSLSTIARELHVSSVSANQMIRKLEGFGLVTYVPYKGVELTEEGSRRADVVLRSRRLWGVFLVDHLGLSAEYADEVACEMEHVTPEGVADRLSGFLGDPRMGPQGKPIPPPHDRSRATVALSEVGAGRTVEIAAAADPFAGFLDAQGIAIGAKVTVLAKGPDGAIVLDGPGGPVHLAAAASGAVSVVD